VLTRKFIEDTTLSEILNINNPETHPVTNIQANVERISKISREENMRLNLEKTKEMVIDLRIMKSEIPVITIDNIPIEREQSHTLLGIWLQSDLKCHTNTFLLLKRPANAYIF
jgi:CRISPR/Cas system CMR-associated protein Cmr3 (group 5 of RAMP superfamily)